MKIVSFILLFVLLFSCQNKNIDSTKDIDLYKLELSRNTELKLYSKYLKSPDEKIIASAINSIGKIQDSVFLDVLSPFVFHTNSNIRENAIFAIGQINSKQSYTLLKSVFDKGNINENLIRNLLKNISESDREILRKIYAKHRYNDLGFDLAIVFRTKFFDESLFNQILTEFDSLNLKEKVSFSYTIRYSDAESIYTHFDRLTQLYFSIKSNDFESISIRNNLLIAIRKIAPKKVSLIQLKYDRFIEKLFSPFLNWRELNTTITLLPNTKRVSMDKKISILINQDLHPYTEIVLSRNINKLKLTKSTLTNYISGSKAIRYENTSHLYSYETLRFITNYFDGLSYTDQTYLINALVNLKNKSVLSSFKEKILTQDPWIKAYFINKVYKLDIFNQTEIKNYLTEKDPAIIMSVLSNLDKIGFQSYAQSFVNILSELDPRKYEYILNQIIEKFIEFNIYNEYFNTGDFNAYLPSQIEKINQVRKVHNLDPIQPNQEEFKYPYSLDDVFSKQARFVEMIFPEKTIRIRLRYDWAPLAAHNFVYLINSGFYNNMEFHRVVPDFVIQAGDNRPDGEGSIPYKIQDEFNSIRYKRGIVGMASYGKDTATSQFFLMQNDSPFLDGKYTAFAEVIDSDRFLDNVTQSEKISIIRVVY